MPLPAARPEQARREPRLTGTEVAERVGPIDLSRMMRLIAERLKNHAPLAHAPISRVCLYFPIAVDETNATTPLRPPGEPAYRGPLWFTIYNTERVIHDRNEREAYVFFKALEDAGQAWSQTLQADRFRGLPARGAVRFELTPAGMALMDPTDSRCVRIGVFEPEAPLRFQQFTPANSRPRFVGRAAFRPSPDAESLIQQLPFLKSLIQIGGAYRGELSYRQGVIDVELLFKLVGNRMDVENVRLPEAR